MKIVLIDTHCHLHDREFFSEAQAKEMLERANAAGVKKIICVGTSHEDSLVARDFANRHDNVYWTYGIHPENATPGWKLEYDFLRAGVPRARLHGARPPYTSAAASGLPQKTYSQFLVAIGEVGLDYHYENYDRKAQIWLFEQMLQLATDNNLPVSFHVREAFNDFFPVVANFPNIRGVVHSFTDSKKILKRILNETEFYIGVNGLATYSTLPTPPIERILLETDAPFLAPIPHRGEKNEPAYVADVAKWLVSKLSLPTTEVAKITTKNASELYKI